MQYIGLYVVSGLNKFIIPGNYNYGSVFVQATGNYPNHFRGGTIEQLYNGDAGVTKIATFYHRFNQLEQFQLIDYPNTFL